MKTQILFIYWVTLQRIGGFGLASCLVIRLYRVPHRMAENQLAEISLRRIHFAGNKFRRILISQSDCSNGAGKSRVDVSRVE